MAGETGGTWRDIAFRASSIPFPGWDPGDQYITKKDPFLLLLDCFSAIAIVV